jgi:hypothetical protein
MAKKYRYYYDRRDGEGDARIGVIVYRNPGYAESLEDFRRKCGHLLGGDPTPATTSTKRDRKAGGQEQRCDR